MFLIIGYVAFGVADGIIGTYPLLYLLWAIVVFLPGLSVTIRRLHDIDKSGWWILVGLIPLIGSIIILIWLVRRGSDGPNRFGEDPLQASQ